MNLNLQKLLSAEFDDAVGFILPTEVMRLRLQSLDAVKNVEKAVRWKEVDEAQFRDFVAKQAAAAVQSEPQPADLALAALAVAVERIPYDYVEEFLCDLASLRIPQLSISSRMARHCLRHYYQLPVNEIRSARFTPAPGFKVSARWRAASMALFPVTQFLRIESIPFRRTSEAP